MWAILEKLTANKKEPPAHVMLVVVMPGNNDIPISGLAGVSLRIVKRDMYAKHQGLKYWAASGCKGKECGEMAKQELAAIAYEDIMNLIFDKKLRPFTGVRIDSEGKAHRDDA